MQLKIRTKLIISFIAPIILLIAVATIISVYIMNSLYNETQRLNAISREISEVADLRLYLDRILMPGNDYIITGNRKYIEDYNAVSIDIERKLNEVEAMLPHMEEIDFDNKIKEKIKILRDVKTAWRNINEISQKIFAIADPIGNRDAARLMEDMDYKWSYPAIEMLKRWKEIVLEEYERSLEMHHRLWRKLWVVIITASISFPILCLLYIIYYSRKFVKNIEALKKGAETIADGNFNHHIDLQTGDEVEELSDIFSNMANKLKVSYASLRESEERYRRLIESSPDMMFRLGGDGTFLDFKPAKGISPYLPPDQFIGKRLSEVLPENVAAPAIDYIKKVFQTKEEQVFEYKLPIKEEVFDYEARLIFISEKEILAIIRDITAKKRLEHEMMRQEKLAGMGQLAAGVAHEIKNPLNIISGNIQILDMEEKDAEKKKIIRTILQQIDRSVKIIDNLLDFARKRKHEIKDIDINSLIEKTIQLVEYEMRTENIVFIRDFQKDIPLIKGDPDELAQVFLNMINNSRDAMNEKQEKIKRGELNIEGWNGEVRITTKKTDDMVEIGFADTGLGIPEDKVANVFKPFFTTKTEGKGTGLGLSIIKNIIEKHNGKIELENRGGEGVRFIIRLPI